MSFQTHPNKNANTKDEFNWGRIGNHLLEKEKGLLQGILISGLVIGGFALAGGMIASAVNTFGSGVRLIESSNKIEDGVIFAFDLSETSISLLNLASGIKNFKFNSTRVGQFVGFEVLFKIWGIRRF